MNNPVRWDDPYGLDTVGAFAQYSFFAGNAGFSIKGGIGFDGLFDGVDGNTKACFQYTVCGRTGAGASTGASGGAEYNTADYCEGDSASAGAWGNVGAGPFGSSSVTTDGDNVKVSGSVGGGVGVAGGAQACITKTICF